MLRPYQTAAIADLRTSFAQGNRSPVLVMPTGSGKTLVAAELTRSAREKGSKVLFLAPRRELIFQTSAKLTAAGVRHAIVMAGEPVSLTAPVQVACIPSLHRRAIASDRMPMPLADVVIVDEAHLSISRTTRDVLAKYPKAVKIGMTATPSRADGRGLGEVYDHMVLGPSVAELTAQGFLVPARYYAGSKPDMDGVKIVRGDYDAKQLGGRADNTVLVGDVVSNWARIAGDRKTVVFAVNRAHSRHLAERFSEIGIRAEHLDGQTENEERADILQQLRSGQIQVVTNCDVLTYGWDEPSISCAVLARPTKSIARYLQMVGRVLRPADGKTDCIVIDHAGAVEDIGFVDDEMPWSLDAKGKIQERREAKQKAEPKPLVCGDCGSTFKPAKHCPDCGAEMGSKYTQAIQSIDEDLTEVDRARRRKNREWTPAEKAAFYGELRQYAADHGYKSGWSDRKYQERLSVWPNAYKHAPLKQPTPETLGWIKHSQIRYAKSKARKAA